MADTLTPTRNPFSSVPVEVTVSVGKARPLIRDLLNFEENAIIPLDSKVDDPVEIYIGEKLIALGQLEEMEGDPHGRLAVKLTQVINVPSAAP